MTAVFSVIARPRSGRRDLAIRAPLYQHRAAVARLARLCS